MSPTILDITRYTIPMGFVELQPIVRSCAVDGMCARGGGAQT